jgi:phosphoenolpyruvate phosphomutase
MFLILNINSRKYQMSISEILRKKLEGNSIIKVGGAFDSMSAKLVESSGFDAVWAGSFAISAVHALPDASILTMSEFFDAASNMSSTCEIPIIADCDTGYGGPSNVRHMVQKYENAGISSICIEDKTFPKQNSLLENGKNDLLSQKEFVAKILAAKEARNDKNLIIIARVEALISGAGMNEALKRATAYEKAGADAILIHSKQKTPDEIFEFTDSWKGSAPIVVVPTTYDSVKISELESHKIKMVIYANQTLRVAHMAMTRLLEDMIKVDHISDIKDKMSTMQDIFDLQEMYDIKNKEKKLEEELKKLGYIN